MGTAPRAKLENVCAAAGEGKRAETGSVSPERCHNRLERVTANDPMKNDKPANDIWPPEVARRFNQELGEDHPILEGPEGERSW